MQLTTKSTYLAVSSSDYSPRDLALSSVSDYNPVSSQDVI